MGYRKSQNRDGRRTAAGGVVDSAARSVVEGLESRQLLSAVATAEAGVVAGSLWNDANGNGARDAAEQPLSGWTVYLDQNRNAKADSGEATAISDGTGVYRFSGLAAGRYYVSAIAPAGWEITSPGPGGVTVSPPPSLPSNLLHFQKPIPTITTTGSTAPIAMQGGSSGSAPVYPSDTESGTLIGLPSMRSDPRFAGIDGTGFSVVVLDTGIDLDHPAFGPDNDGNGVADRIVYSYDFSASNGGPGDDFDDHGSNVASIAAGEGAWGGLAPGANIISLKVINAFLGGQFSYLEKALQWVVANTAKYNIATVNMSLGDGANYASATSLYGLGDELAALSAQDVIVVAATGNDYKKFDGQQGVAYPAADPNVLGVGAVFDANVGSLSGNGATNSTSGPDQITAFTQRSTLLTDVFAPGATITGANQDGATVAMNGTSQASPHVAGAAVLAQQLATRVLGRRLTVDEFRTLMRNAAVTINDGDDENDNVINTGADYKRLDLYALEQAIYAMGQRVPFGYTVDVVAGQGWDGLEIGARPLATAPGKPDLDRASDSGISTVDNLTKQTSSIKFTIPRTATGTTVRVYIDGVLAVTTPAGNGYTLVTLPGPYANGVHSVTATQQYPGLPVSATSVPVSFTIDTVAPAAPAAPDLLAASDTGISSTDNITNDTSPSFAVTVGAGEYYELFRGTTSLSNQYETKAAFTLPKQPEGVSSYSAIARDAAGNASARGAALDVTIDTVPWIPAGAVIGGALDSAYGVGGISSQNRSGDQSVVKAFPLPDGGTVVVGNTSYSNASPSAVYLARYTATGQLDTSFGTNGFYTTTPPDGRDWAEDAEMAPDGSIYIAGTYSLKVGTTSFSDRGLLMKFGPDGTLDTTFGSGGRVLSKYGTNAYFNWEGLGVQADGRVLATGSSAVSGTTPQIVTARFLPNGTLDTSFDGDGVLTLVDVSLTKTFEFPRDVVTGGPGGSIYVVVMAGDSLDGGIGIARILPNGQLDTTFGTGGHAEVWFPNDWNIDPNAVLIQPDGKLVFAMKVNANGVSNPGMVRLLPNGQVDTSFGDDGFVMEDALVAGQAQGEFRAITMDAEGRIIVAGNANGLSSTGALGHFVVSRYLSNGQPDPSFGTGGHTINHVLSGINLPKSVYLDGNGRIVVGGTTWPSFTTAGTSEMVLMRLMPGTNSVPAAPTLDAASDTGASASDRITADTTPTLNLPVVNGYWLDVYRENGVKLTASPVGNGGAWTAPSLADGSHQLSYEVLDAAGNRSLVSLPLSVQIDTTQPTSTIDAVAPNPRLDAVDSIVVRLSEPVSGLTVAAFTLTRDGGANLLTGSESLNSSDGGLTYTLSGLSALTGNTGAYSLVLHASGSIADVAGNALAADATANWSTLPAAPTAAAGGPYTVAEGNAVTLDGSASIGTGLAAYEWDFDYDGSTFSVDATGVAPSFSAATLDGPAARTVGLRVKDAYGRVSGVATATVSVTNVATTATFAAGPAVTLGTASTVDFTNAVDPSLADIAAGLRYSFDFNNDGDFTDTGDVADSTTPSAAFTFGSAGSYTVHGRVADKDGDGTDYTATVTVNQPLPPPPPPPVSTTRSVRSPADAYVADGGSASTNFGTKTELDVRKSATTGSNRESYLRFSLTGGAAASVIDAAHLRLFTRLSAAGSVQLDLYAVSNTTWGETSIKWSNKPASTGSIIASKTVSSTTAAWLDFDVSSYVKQQRAAGATAVSFVVRSHANSTPYAIIVSDEASANRPALQLTEHVAPAILLNKTSVNVSEGGSDASVMATLSTQPAGPVTVTFTRTSGDTDLSVAFPLTFTPSNWNVPQRVTLLAAVDADSTNGVATFQLTADGGYGTATLKAIEFDKDVAKTYHTLGDTYVRDGTSAGTNFGQSSALQVRKSTTVGNTRYTLLLFDLTPFNSFSSATLRLNGKLDVTTNPSVTVQVFGSSNTSWTESNVNWNNKPAVSGSAIGQFVVSGTTSQWYTINIAPWLAAQKAAGKTTAAFVLMSPTATTSMAVFASDEGSANGPQMVVKA